MKLKTFFLTLVLLSAISVVRAADGRVVPVEVGSSFPAEDGTVWAGMDAGSKIAYLKGLALGTGMGGAVILDNYNLTSSDDSKRAWMALDTYSPKGNYDKMVQYIDWIYETPENRQLKILDAYTSLAFIQSGDMQESELGEFFKNVIAGYKKSGTAE